MAKIRTQPVSATVSPPRSARILMLTGFGNMLELYDFTLFAILMPFFLPVFFPHSSNEGQVLFGYLAFAISFLIAPIGSIMWGYLGDKYGSARIFRLSLIIMAFPSLGIALLPGFEQWGFASIVILLILRVMQGISASGEVLGSKIYAFDRLGSGNYYRASAFISCMGAVGVLVAAQSGALLSEKKLISSWREPFLLAAFFLFVVIILRQIFDPKGKENRKKNIQISSIISVIKTNSQAASAGFAASAMLGIMSYFMHAYSYDLQTRILHFDMVTAYQNIKIGLYGTIASSGLIFLCQTFKIFNINKFEPVLVLRTTIIAICSLLLPLYYAILHDGGKLASLALFVFGSLVGVYASFCSVVVITLFNHEARCRGALLVNALGVSIFGGLTPLTLFAATKISIFGPALLMLAAFAIVYLVLSNRKI